MEQITVERDGAANIRFKGELIATTSSSANNASSYYSGSTGRWRTLSLWKTAVGKYVGQTVGHGEGVVGPRVRAQDKVARQGVGAVARGAESEQAVAIPLPVTRDGSAIVHDHIRIFVHPGDCISPLPPGKFHDSGHPKRKTG